MLLRQSAAEGLIDLDEGRFSENVLLFGDLRAREVMVPRPEVDSVTTDDSIGDVAQRSIETGHTRLPVCEPEGGLDAAIGVIHVKDLLPALVQPGKPSVRDLARPLVRVSESVLLDELLRDLRRAHAHIALVVDEHGTTIGLVTLEDIIEEIVGEIEDEFDADQEDLIEQRDGRAVVSGAAPLRLVAERLGVEVDDSHEATIGGYVVELLRAGAGRRRAGRGRRSRLRGDGGRRDPCRRAGARRAQRRRDRRARRRRRRLTPDTLCRWRNGGSTPCSPSAGCTSRARALPPP